MRGAMGTAQVTVAAVNCYARPGDWAVEFVSPEDGRSDMAGWPEKFEVAQ